MTNVSVGLAIMLRKQDLSLNSLPFGICDKVTSTHNTSWDGYLTAYVLKRCKNSMLIMHKRDNTANIYHKEKKKKEEEEKKKKNAANLSNET